jgi:tRNA modification GTPase
VFSTDDTIVAVATPPGRGAIGVVRISGPGAHAIARRVTTHAKPFEARQATLTMIRGAASGPELPDQVIVTFFPAPRSYTGDDTVEISAHGSPVVLRGIVAAAVGCGARLAEPGEFTLRAFLNARIDLVQAEAVADLIESVTPLQARVAFDQLQGTLTESIAAIDAALFDLVARLEASVDFPEEGYHFVEPGSLAHVIDTVAARVEALVRDARRGRLVRDGLQVAIVGKPNVGKSSLFNALAGACRAIVTEVPGTTRDVLTEVVDIDGLRVTLADTAGLRETRDVVEVEGVARAQRSAAVADIVLAVLDQSDPDGHKKDVLSTQKIDNKAVIHIANKADLKAAWSDPDTLPVSALTGQGIDALRRRMAEALGCRTAGDRPGVTNLRHAALLQRAFEALTRARSAAWTGGRSLPEEFVLADLQEARAHLEAITGRRTPDDVLEHIFGRFCIGK